MPGVGDALPNGQHEKSEFIIKWIEEGAKPGKDLPLLDILEARLTPTSDRKQALLDAIQELQNQYKNIWEEYKNASWQSMPEMWELKDDIDLALSDIYNYVNELHTVSARTSA
jgi:archaellum component FlaC